MSLIKEIRNRAKASPKTIALPEGNDERVLKAAEIVKKEKLAKVVLLGNQEKLKGMVKDLDLSGVEFIDLEVSPKVEEYATLLYELRKHKGMTMEKAIELTKDPIWYGTLMVKNKDVDGMVAGAATATGDVFRPAFQIVKTAPGIGVVSSAFMMIMPQLRIWFKGEYTFC